jgi:t-SNARE complex subunit, syntaxin
MLNIEQNHAISRSAELLSVAKTSLRILQQQSSGSTAVGETPLLHPELQSLDPNHLALHDERLGKPSNAAMDALDEAALTLSLLDSTLDTLRNLVKRRGATNDPTEQINEAIASFHSYSKGILEVVQNALPQSAVLSPYDDRIVRATSQRVKHYEIVANILQTSVDKRNQDFKSIMTLRGEILKEQTLRRKKLLSHSNITKLEGAAVEENVNSSTIPLAPSSGGVRLVGKGITAPQGTERLAKSQLMTSPLFTVEPLKKTQYTSNNVQDGNNVNMNKTGKTSANIYKQHTAPNLYGSGSKTTVSNGYGGVGYGKSSIPVAYGAGAGAGGNSYNGTSNSFGVRRRAAGGSSSALKVDPGYDAPNQEEENKIHESNSVMAQIQMRRESRQTQQRLESARQAERSLAELTTMFSKMSNLIQSQGETLVKIEDDVEAAMDHVEAGREEIIKLYEWTKGNRGLIIKIFGLLIFFIVFMRFYG